MPKAPQFLWTIMKLKALNIKMKWWCLVSGGPIVDLGVGETPMSAKVRAWPVQLGAVRALSKGDVRLKFKTRVFEF